MNVAQFIFGKRRRASIDEAPDDVDWRRARPKPSPPVSAWLAQSDCSVETGQGPLKARGGKDYIVEYARGDRAVVRRDIFERTYAPGEGGKFVKRTDVVLRYFVLEAPAVVETLEGPQSGAAGDWVMQGVAGELWPVPAAKALSKYDPI